MSNIIVVPLVPIVMVTTFAAGVFMLVSGNWFATKVLLLIPTAILGFILYFAEKVAMLPFAEFRAGLTFAQMVIVYVCIIFATWVLHKKTHVGRPYDLLE